LAAPNGPSAAVIRFRSRRLSAKLCPSDRRSSTCHGNMRKPANKCPASEMVISSCRDNAVHGRSFFLAADLYRWRAMSTFPTVREHNPRGARKTRPLRDPPFLRQIPWWGSLHATPNQATYGLKRVTRVALMALKPEGLAQISPGQRPGGRRPRNRSALKGRNNRSISNVSLIEFNAMPHEQLSHGASSFICDALSGLMCDTRSCHPGVALGWFVTAPSGRIQLVRVGSRKTRPTLRDSHAVKET